MAIYIPKPAEKGNNLAPTHFITINIMVHLPCFCDYYVGLYVNAGCDKRVLSLFFHAVDSFVSAKNLAIFNSGEAEAGLNYLY